MVHQLSKPPFHCRRTIERVVRKTKLRTRRENKTPSRPRETEDKLTAMDPREKKLRMTTGPPCGACIRGGEYHVPVAAIGGLTTAQRHVAALTFAPREAPGGSFGQAPEPVVAGRVLGDEGGDGVLVVPRCYGLEHFGAPGDCDGDDDPPRRADMGFNGFLREGGHQTEAAGAVLSALRDPLRRGATLVLPCGFGKTVVSLFVASQLGLRTLVLCHKSCLVEQWMERISQYLPEARTGVVQGKRAEASSDFTISVGMLQSIYSREYPPGTLDGFGLLIVDEAHHVPAATFMTAVLKVGARATLALTATPDRKDGLEGLMYAVMGATAYRADRPPTAGCVRIRKLPCSPSVRERRLRGPVAAKGEARVNLSKLITDLSADRARTDSIVGDILQLLDPQEGAGAAERHVMVLSDRTDQLKAIRTALVAAKHPAIADDEHGGASLLIGSTKPRDRAAALQSRVVLTTYPFSQEGVDQPRLDTLVIGTPKGDVVQAVGRILREHPAKATPLVLDYTESVESGVLCGLFAKRKRTYARDYGFEIVGAE